MKNSNSSKILLITNLVFLLLLTAAFVILACSLVISKDGYRNLDFFTFWLGGRLTSQGQDVYRLTAWVDAHKTYGSTWLPNLYYVYPLTTAAFFVPLGILSIESASLIWLVLSFCLIVASLIMLLSLWRVPSWTKYVIPFSLGLLLFRPVILIFLMGQIDGLLLFVIALSLFFISKRDFRTANILLSFLVLKPNIGVPLLCFYALWLSWQKQWKNILVLGGSSLALFILPMLIDPQWIGKYISVGLLKSQGQNLYPTLRGLAGLIAGGNELVTNLIWIGSSILLIVVVAWIIFKNNKRFSHTEIISLSMIITLLITPYLRSYDFLLLLIPILPITKSILTKTGSFLKTTLCFLLWGVFSFVLLFLATFLQHDIWSVAFPIAVLSFYITTLARPVTLPVIS